MNKHYSYSFLIPATLSFIGLFFGFIYWQVHINRVTFLHSSMLYAVFITALLISPVTTFWLIRRVKENGDDIAMRLKRVAASFMVSLFLISGILYFLVNLLAWVLPGEESYYSARFTYTSGGRNSCSGAEVYDPDMQKDVRVCYPVGDYYSPGIIVVHKRTNMLGAVMLDGRLLR